MLSAHEASAPHGAVALRNQILECGPQGAGDNCRLSQAVRSFL